jgi:hypothetical protein
MYNEFLNRVIESQETTIEGISKKFGISKNKITAALIESDVETYSSLIELSSQIPMKNFKIYNSFENIKDIKDIEVTDTDISSDYIMTEIIFVDQNNNLRKANLYSDLIPGMITYYLLHETIKADLIDIINFTYNMEKDNK